MSRETQADSKTELDRRTFLGAAGGLTLAMAATEGAAAQPEDSTPTERSTHEALSARQ